MIIDAHCHAGLGDGLTGPWDTEAPLGRYLRRARAAGIDRTVVMAAFCSDYSRANRAVARLLSRHRPRLWAWAFVHAARDRGRIADMIGEAIEELGFRGVKVHGADARISREVCEAARRFDVPVLYDVHGDVAQVELIAQQYPDVDFVIPHLGSFSDRWDHQLAMIDHLARHPNVYADTSAVRRFDLLVDAVRRAGPRKLLFGSDGPWFHPGLELAKVTALGLSPRDARLVLGDNAVRLLGE
jgi:uncharacterized protein